MDTQENEPNWLYRPWISISRRFGSVINMQDITIQNQDKILNNIIRIIKKFPESGEYMVTKLTASVHEIADEAKQRLDNTDDDDEFMDTYLIWLMHTSFVGKLVGKLFKVIYRETHKEMTNQEIKLEHYWKEKNYVSTYNALMLESYWDRIKKLMLLSIMGEFEKLPINRKFVRKISYIVTHTDWEASNSLEQQNPNYEHELVEIYTDCITYYLGMTCAFAFYEMGPLQYVLYALQHRELTEKRDRKYYLETNEDVEDANRDVFYSPLSDTFETPGYFPSEIPLSNYMSDEKSLDALKELGLIRLILEVVEYSEPLVESFQRFIYSRGLAEMKQREEYIGGSCERYVEVVYRMKSEYQKIIDVVFDYDPAAEKAFFEAFRRIFKNRDIHVKFLSDPMIIKMNPNPENMSHAILSVFGNRFLRKSAKNENLSLYDRFEKSEILGSVIECVPNPDTFMKLYVKNFRERMLFNRSTSLDIEKELLNTIFRYNFSFKEHARTALMMFADLQATKDFCNLHVTKLKRSEYRKIHLKILNSLLWAKNYQGFKITVPKTLGSFIIDTSRLYKKKYSKRKLIWNHHTSHGTIIFSTNYGSFDLEITGVQLTVLWLWKNPKIKQISFRKLKIVTGLPDTELQKTLMQFIACSSLQDQVLVCSTKVDSGNQFTDDTDFWINDDFALIKNGKRLTKGKVNLMVGSG